MKRKIVSLFVFLFFNLLAWAQNPSYQQKLYYSCKLWGFVKYYHSEVSNCKVNWDSVLISHLPTIKAAATNNDFNNALASMLNAAGPMAIATSQFSDTTAPELKRNRDFSWTNDTVFRSDIRVILDTIENNFRPHKGCWVIDNPYTNSYYGWLVFPHDSLMLNSNWSSVFPNEQQRLTVLFKYWNIINYFNPYNYIMDQPWDTTLFQHVVSIANASNLTSFVRAFKKVTSQLNDAHVEGLTYTTSYAYPDYYLPYIKLRYAESKYLVVKSVITGISPGDEIISVGGVASKQMEDSLDDYISAGDSSVFRRFMCNSLLAGAFNTQVTFVYKDSLGNSNTKTLPRLITWGNNWQTDYYPTDSLKLVNWRKWSCNVGYVNMGNLQSADVNAMYSALQNTSSIIFDLRNYPNGTAWPIADLMYPQVTKFAKNMLPDVTYPGTYYWVYHELGKPNNSNAYKGKVILLFDQETQSQAEYSCMILGAQANVVKIGGQTAGTDGNVTYFRLGKDFQAGFTSLGIFYPNGDSTQRIGIVPDSVVHPTQASIRKGQDNALLKALQVAGCLTSMRSSDGPTPNVSIFPNPSNGTITIELGSWRPGTRLNLINALGQQMRSFEIESQTSSITLNCKPGIYFCQLLSPSGELIATQKLIITDNE